MYEYDEDDILYDDSDEVTASSGQSSNKPDTAVTQGADKSSVDDSSKGADKSTVDDSATDKNNNDEPPQ